MNDTIQLLKEVLNENDVSNKYKITSWNKHLIPISKLCSFLDVEIERSTGDWLGKDTGWTIWVGENNLIVKGGWFKGEEYLDSIQYKEKLNNVYNNYVTPFDIWEILNEEGKAFFIDYYRKEIVEELAYTKRKITSINSKLKKLRYIKTTLKELI